MHVVCYRNIKDKWRWTLNYCLSVFCILLQIYIQNGLNTKGKWCHYVFYGLGYYLTNRKLDILENIIKKYLLDRYIATIQYLYPNYLEEIETRVFQSLEILLLFIISSHQLYNTSIPLPQNYKAYTDSISQTSIFTTTFTVPISTCMLYGQICA
jgi:hypothetical protein